MSKCVQHHQEKARNQDNDEDWTRGLKLFARAKVKRYTGRGLETQRFFMRHSGGKRASRRSMSSRWLPRIFVFAHPGEEDGTMVLVFLAYLSDHSHVRIRSVVIMFSRHMYAWSCWSHQVDSVRFHICILDASCESSTAHASALLDRTVADHRTEGRQTQDLGLLTIFVTRGITKLAW